MNISRSHLENCTAKIALSWGICQSHFYQFKINKHLSVKIVHLALAIIQAIPGIGQFVSFIELKIVRLIYLRKKTIEEMIDSTPPPKIFLKSQSKILSPMIKMPMKP
jgi:hypothetical protein